MAAQILILTGVGAGTSIRIDEPEMRIGSSRDMEIHLSADGMPALAATVRFDSGVYQVENHTDQPLDLSGVMIEPGDTVEWDDHEELRFPDGSQLRLELVSDTVPHVGGDGELDDETDEMDEDESEETKPSIDPEKLKAIIQLSVTALCLVGVVWILSMDDTDSGGGTLSGDIPGLSMLIEDSYELGWIDDPKQKLPPEKRKIEDLLPPDKSEVANLVQRLQIAEGHRIRGQYTESVRHFSVMLDTLERDKKRWEGLLRYPDDIQEKNKKKEREKKNELFSRENLLKYVKAKLDQLASEADYESDSS